MALPWDGTRLGVDPTLEIRASLRSARESSKPWLCHACRPAESVEPHDVAGGCRGNELGVWGSCMARHADLTLQSRCALRKTQVIEDLATLLRLISSSSIILRKCAQTPIFVSPSPPSPMTRCALRRDFKSLCAIASFRKRMTPHSRPCSVLSFHPTAGLPKRIDKMWRASQERLNTIIS